MKQETHQQKKLMIGASYMLVKNEILKHLNETSFLITCKYSHNNNFMLHFNGLNNVLTYLWNYLHDHTVIEFLQYLKKFDMKNFVKMFNDSINCKSCYILTTALQEYCINNYVKDLYYQYTK